MLTERFSSACKADDLINSCNNLINNLSQRYCFYVLTSARNIGDKKNEGVVVDKWIAQTDTQTNKNVVRYVSKNNLTTETITQIIKKINPHVIYINTMLSLHYSLLPLYVLKKIGFAGKIIISPLQVLKPKGIGINTLKRKCFAFLFTRFQLQANVGFHVSAENDISLMRKYFGQKAQVFMAENFPDFELAEVYQRNRRKNTISAGI